MDDQRARIADIGEVREQFEGLDKLDAGLVATLQAESEDRACTLGRIFLLQGMVLVVREARIGYPGNLRVLFQPCRDGRCIVAVTLHPERQGFKPREDEEGVERRNRRTQVAQAKYACCDGEGEIAEGLVKDHAAIVRPRLGQKRNLARLRPVEVAAVNKDAADGIAMAADELGKRMDDYVCAMLYRADEVGRSKRVVHNQRQAMFARHFGNPGDIHEFAAGVGQALYVKRLGPVVDQLFETRRVVDIGPAHLPAEVQERLAELVDRAAVELAGGNEIVTRLHKRVERKQMRRLPGCGGECRRTALERGDALLQNRLGGVHDASVDIAERLQAEQRGCVVGAVEHEGGGLIDRRGTRAGSGIWLGSRMDRKRVETWCALAHKNSPSTPRDLGHSKRRRILGQGCPRMQRRKFPKTGNIDAGNSTQSPRHGISSSYFRRMPKLW